MSATPSAPHPETPRFIAAVVYPNEHYPQAVFEGFVRHCRDRKLRMAGVLQHPSCAPDAHHCDIVLEDLADGSRTPIFESRGAAARGCRLDSAALADVTGRIAAAMQCDPDILLLNKFGKVEAEGGGLVDLIGEAVARQVPAVIAVPQRNLAAWRAFAEDYATELSVDLGALQAWCGSVTSKSAADRDAA